MTTTADVVGVLTEADVSATRNLSTRTLGTGRCWVRLDSFALEGTIEVEVTAAVPISGDIEAYSLAVWDALDASRILQPVAIEWDYFAAPFPGHDPAHVARLSVVTNQRPPC